MLRLYARRKTLGCGFFNGFSMFSFKTNNALTFWKCARGGFFRLWVIFAKVFEGKRGFIRVFSMQMVVRGASWLVARGNGM